MYNISREIGIDAAHRVPTHGSKCANLHGHRYRIIAEVSALLLHQVGEQSHMVLDFGFLKKLMVDEIDYYCDHGLIMWEKDPLLKFFTDQNEYYITMFNRFRFRAGKDITSDIANLSQVKLLVVDFIPTAEKLAEFWFNQMKDDVINLSHGLGELKSVTVWETPNCVATYRPE